MKNTLQKSLKAALIPLVSNAVNRFIDLITDENILKRPAPKAVETPPAPAMRKKPTSYKVSTKVSVSKPKQVRGRARISEAAQGKIREGFRQNKTIEQVASFAGVSKSTAARYKAQLAD